jgi:hypothetical protein
VGILANKDCCPFGVAHVTFTLDKWAFGGK